MTLPLTPTIESRADGEAGGSLDASALVARDDRSADARARLGHDNVVHHDVALEERIERGAVGELRSRELGGRPDRDNRAGRQGNLTGLQLLDLLLDGDVGVGLLRVHRPLLLGEALNLGVRLRGLRGGRVLLALGRARGLRGSRRWLGSRRLGRRLRGGRGRRSRRWSRRRRLFDGRDGRFGWLCGELLLRVGELLLELGQARVGSPTPARRRPRRLLPRERGSSYGTSEQSWPSPSRPRRRRRSHRQRRDPGDAVHLTTVSCSSGRRIDAQHARIARLR